MRLQPLLHESSLLLCCCRIDGGRIPPPTIRMMIMLLLMQRQKSDASGILLPDPTSWRIIILSHPESSPSWRPATGTSLNELHIYSWQRSVLYLIFQKTKSILQPALFLLLLFPSSSWLCSPPLHLFLPSLLSTALSFFHSVLFTFDSQFRRKVSSSERHGMRWRRRRRMMMMPLLPERILCCKTRRSFNDDSHQPLSHILSSFCAFYYHSVPSKIKFRAIHLPLPSKFYGKKFNWIV